jgi:GT2 family glycosyltransferase
VEVFGASGGLALLRSELLADVGLLEESFFAYLEDADLAWRARLQGWGCVVAPKARASHVYSATGGHGSPLKARLLARNRLRLLARCWPTALLLRCAAAIARYDGLAMGYGLYTGQRAIVAGRLAFLGELRIALGQRRAIQAGRTAPVRRLHAWLEPAPAPQQVLREARELDAVLADR